MRTFASTVIGLSTALVMTACVGTRAAARESLQFDSERPILTRHSTPHQRAEGELDAVLADLFAADAGAVPKPLVVYVHGRGHEPKKSFADSVLGTSNRVIEKIEQHGVVVLGINWDSAPPFWHPFCGRPVETAVEAGPLFARSVHALVAYRAGHPDLWRNRKTILLVHSMGGFVLRDAMKRLGVPNDVATLFDVRIISESDVPAAEHLKWVPAATEGRTYVITNPKDEVLARSTRCDKPHASEIGPRLGTLPAAQAPSAPLNVTYIQLAAGGRHRVFTKAGANKNPFVCHVMDALLHGKEPDLDGAWRVGDNAFSIPEKSDPSDPCFVGELPDDDDDD